MRDQDSAIAAPSVSPAAAPGFLLAALGVASFSFSFPATEWALHGLGPWTVAGVRGMIAALIAGAALIGTRARLPRRDEWPALLTVAAGCVIGFPLLTTLALQISSTAHSAVVIGVLPIVTAGMSALRTGRHSSNTFWWAAAAGAMVVVTFAVLQSHGRPTTADLYLFAALVLCAAGYAEGGRMAGRMPGWKVIGWGAVLAAPASLVVSVLALHNEPVHVTVTVVSGMAYLGAISQFGGYVVWYQGMGLIGVHRASQIQLAQPLLTLIWALAIMGEALTPTALVAAAAVLICIVLTQRAGSRDAAQRIDDAALTTTRQPTTR